jgi:hypothetical protein
MARHDAALPFLIFHVFPTKSSRPAERGDRFVRRVALRQSGEVSIASERGAGTTVDLMFRPGRLSASTRGTALQAASNVGGNADYAGSALPFEMECSPAKAGPNTTSSAFADCTA